jgi:hypothetical protein
MALTSNRVVKVVGFIEMWSLTTVGSKVAVVSGMRNQCIVVDKALHSG